ncbi:MAG: leucyl/phenylalanyl-tRNA--protein transferase [Planctomycetota bacterium]
MTLHPAMLEHAYRNACFPMPNSRGRIGWYRPDPRAILPLDGFHASRSLKRKLASGYFQTTYDTDFLGVMKGCSNRPQTWITDEFFEAYTEMHRLGKAHSVEVWREGKLVGGTYGVHFGGAFFAESKFHTETDASKVALAMLVERLNARGFALLEVQYWTEHLAQFGVIEIPDAEYVERLNWALELTCEF